MKACLIPRRRSGLPLSMVLLILLICSVSAGYGHAASAAQDVNVSTPEIEAVRDSLKMRAERLFPFLDSGLVGIGLDGFLKIRSVENLGLQERAAAQRLVEEDNHDRLILYQEIAGVNGFPDKVAEVQAIFAETWKEKAAPGWFLETEQGGWEIK